MQSIVTNNFVRGGISGLGLVNLAVGFIDLSRVFASRDRTSLPIDVSDVHSDST